jgi:translation initiation factor 1
MKEYDSGGARLIYSTSSGSICPECGRPIRECICNEMKKEAIPSTPGVFKIFYDTKGRKGKGMTLIKGLPLSETGLLNLAKGLKQKFGTGGSVKDYTIELQGDHREEAAQELKKLGYK